MWVKQGNEVVKVKYMRYVAYKGLFAQDIFFSNENNDGIRFRSEFATQVFDKICDWLKANGDNIYIDLDLLEGQFIDEDYGMGDQE